MDAAGDQQLTGTPPPLKVGWWKRIRRAVVLYLLVPYLAVVIIFVVLQRKLIYRPTVANDLRVTTVGLDAEAVRDVQIQTPDGEKLNGWLMQQAGDDGAVQRPLVVYFPGNSLNRYERINDLREVVRCGFDVLIFDYRGYGDSSGSPSEQHLASDAMRVWNYACGDLGYEPGRIVIFGESLGGAVALSLWTSENANPPQPGALILNATFVSMPRTVAGLYPLFPFQYLLLDRWPSIERITRVTAPVVVFHGTEDDMVPVAHGRELAEAAADGQFIKIPGAGHNEIPLLRLCAELECLELLDK
ncbi:Alpha/beta hydrolase family protein [Symmachiella dynata]|uniref:Alpha/beta hydrolase family protein n=1 Tax=Symmachiella dynata TaxID=2527995 RepID=A0A517ZS31_9PLAN|nr:alpha/beta hydrolase [Symmachiella dynata]QDU45299.1 Alpha/beta hydrolase family protein [Symmachiella dynata]